jgi:hypothetical protein
VTSKYLEEPEGKSSGFKPGGSWRLPKVKLMAPVESTARAFGPT